VITDPVLRADSPPGAARVDWFANPTWGRRPNLDLVLAHYRTAYPHFTDRAFQAVEVGSMRKPGDTEGDGCATVAWGTLAKERGGTLFSIDADFLAVEYANRLRRYGFPVIGVQGKGEDLLRLLPVGTIDFLYLDGSDDPLEALLQLDAVKGRLAPGAVLMVDDFRQKGPEVARFMHNEVLSHRARPFDGLDPKWNQAAWIVGL
jgi:hypothetical protein